jgi:hypothetical protein
MDAVFPDEILLEIAWASPYGWTGLYRVNKSLHNELVDKKDRARSHFLAPASDQDKQRFENELGDGIKFDANCRLLIEPSGELCGMCIIVYVKYHNSYRLHVPFRYGKVHGAIDISKQRLAVYPLQPYAPLCRINVYDDITITLHRFNECMGGIQYVKTLNIPFTIKSMITGGYIPI